MFNYQDDKNDRWVDVADKARRFRGCLCIAIGVVVIGLAGFVFYEDGWREINACLVMLLIAAVSFVQGYFLVRRRY